MAYNSAIPQATDRIAQSQLDLLNNFIEINTLVGINHIGFNVADQGKHNFVQFPTAVPTKTTGASEVALYSKNDPTTGLPALFFQKNSLGVDAGYSFTASNQQIKGWMRTPSGILIKWGDDNSAPSGNEAKTFPVNDGMGNNIPAFTSTPWIILFVVTNGGFASWDLTGTNNTTTYTISTFSGVGTLTSRNYRFLAVGI